MHSSFFCSFNLNLWKMHSFLYEFILHPESLNYRLPWWHIMGVHIISKHWNGPGGRWYKLFHIHYQPLSFQTLPPHHKAKLSWSAWFHGHMIVGCEEFWDVDKSLHIHTSVLKNTSSWMEIVFKCYNMKKEMNTFSTYLSHPCGTYSSFILSLVLLCMYKN